MVANRLVCRSPVMTEDSEAIYALLALHWQGIDDVCRNGRIAHSHLDWNVSRIGLIGEQIVTYWGVYDIQMRIGTARVRTAGVNLPITHPDHRGQGLMTRTMAHSLGVMREQGYGLSVINNTHAYFLRFGYVFAWPQTHFFVRTTDLPDEPPALRLQKVNAYEIMGRADLAAIYNRQNTTVTGTAVRPTYRRSKHPVGDFTPGYVLTDDRGQVAGYLLDGPPDESGQRYWHDDSAGDSEQRLRILGMLARRHECEGVYFHRLPFVSELAMHLRRLNCTVTVEYRNDGGYLVRIIDLASTLMAMAGELSNRLAKSHLAQWCGELLVRVEDQQAVLIVDRSCVHVGTQARTPHRLEGDQHIAQLLVGTYPPLEAVATGSIALSGEAGALVEVLFPPQYPQMPNEDL